MKNVWKNTNTVRRIQSSTTMMTMTTTPSTRRSFTAILESHDWRNGGRRSMILDRNVQGSTTFSLLTTGPAVVSRCSLATKITPDMTMMDLRRRRYSSTSRSSSIISGNGRNPSSVGTGVGSSRCDDGTGTKDDSTTTTKKKNHHHDIQPLFAIQDENNNNINNNSSNNDEMGEATVSQYQILLEAAAAESQRILDQTTLSSALHMALQQTGASSAAASSSAASSYASSISPRLGQVGLLERMKDLEKATESLLQVTKSTIPLAQLILLTQSSSSSSQKDDRVISIHRTFLTILGKCVTVLRNVMNDPQQQRQKTKQQRQTTSSSSSRNNKNHQSTLQLENDMNSQSFQNDDDELYLRRLSLLDKTIRLAIRARGDLGLVLHLPLYQGLALCVAQSSSSSTLDTSSAVSNNTSTTTTSNPSHWIGQFGTWAYEDFGFNPTQHHDYFTPPLCALAQRRSYDDVLQFLRIILKKKKSNTITTKSNNNHSNNNTRMTRMKKKRIPPPKKDWVCSVDYLEERTMSQLFRILYDDLKTHLWEPQNKLEQPDLSNVSTSSATLEEVLTLLEPSVWKFFDEEQDGDDENDEDGVVSLWSKASYENPDKEGDHHSNTFLRDAIDILVSPQGSKNGTTTTTINDEEDSTGDGKGSSHRRPLSLEESRELLHALFPEEFLEDVESLEFWEEDDEDYSTDDSRRNAILEETERHLTMGKWELHVDMDSDLSIVALTRRPFSEEDDDDDDDDFTGQEDDSDDDDKDTDDGWSQREISRGKSSNIKWQRLETVPDIVHQIEVATGQQLQYSKPFQIDLLHDLI